MWEGGKTVNVHGMRPMGQDLPLKQTGSLLQGRRNHGGRRERSPPPKIMSEMKVKPVLLNYILLLFIPSDFQTFLPPCAAAALYAF